MKDPGTPLISIISINYNEPALTYLFLDSVNKVTYKNIEVLIVENNSSRPVSQEEAIRHFAGTRVIFSPVNGGFGSGNNLGLNAAKGEYLFVVNNDTELCDTIFENLLIPFENAHIGVVCPKIVYFDAPEIIQYAGFTPINQFTGRNKAIAYGQHDKGQFDQPGKTFGAHGAAMLVRRVVFEKTGGFYEPYFLYYEELDWSYRIFEAGYEIYYQPSAVVYHKESMSVGKNSPLKIFYLARNRLLFMKRNSPGYRYWIFVIYNLLVALPVHATRYLLKKQFTLLFALLKGNFKGLFIASGSN